MAAGEGDDKLPNSYVMRKLGFMQRLRHKLPPPSLLIAFEAAGRHLSFTKAASEMNVSRVAVSQQIRALEEFLDVRLFHRQQRAIKLTRFGERYHLAISDALDWALRATLEITQPTGYRRGWANCDRSILILNCGSLCPTQISVLMQ
jgi:hypothetical protein